MLSARLFFGSMMILAMLAVLGIDPYLSPPAFPLLAIVIATIVWLGAGELCDLLHEFPLPVRKVPCQIASTLIVLANWIPHVTVLPADIAFQPPAGLVAFVFFMMGAIVHATVLYREPGRAVAELAAHALVLFYMGVLGSFVVANRWHDPASIALGSVAFCLTIFVPKAGDCGAYFVGRMIGRHKITPILSPGKTWEGTIGGWIASTLSACLIVWLGELIGGKAFCPQPIAAVMGFVLGITGQIGDLTESLIKRDCRRKDSSESIPGFGGILDVIDSVLFAGPIAWAMFQWLKFTTPG